MQAKTTGIILHTTKYTDKATIVTVYTQHYGRVSYLVYGANNKKSNCRAALLQPFSIVDIEAKHSPGKDIQQIREMRMEHQFSSIPFDSVKISMSLFLTEILFKTLRQSEPDESLFLFVENSILQFDCCQTGIQNFHLIFLLKLTRYLGFEPNVEEFGEYFDLLNGVFQDFKPAHVHFLMPEVTLNFKKLLEIDYSSLDKLILSRENRMVLLLSIIEYYRLHIPEFQQLQSLSVLQGLFD